MVIFLARQGEKVGRSGAGDRFCAYDPQKASCSQKIKHFKLTGNLYQPTQPAIDLRLCY